MNNPPAFPTERTIGANKDNTWIAEIPGQKGMTLRDYFAARVMQAIVGDPTLAMPEQNVAKHAYQMADAMLKEREA